MALIIPINFFDSGDRAWHILKCQKPFPHRKMIAQSRIFSDDWTAAREIPQAPITDPAGFELPVDRLRTKNLGA